MFRLYNDDNVQIIKNFKRYLLKKTDNLLNNIHAYRPGQAHDVTTCPFDWIRENHPDINRIKDKDIQGTIFEGNRAYMKFGRNDAMEYCRILLEDYSRPRSSWNRLPNAAARFFSGHWGRNHCPAVEEVLKNFDNVRSDGQPLYRNIQDVYDAILEQDETINKQGSLYKRLFLCASLHDEQLNDEKPNLTIAISQA